MLLHDPFSREIGEHERNRLDPSRSVRIFSTLHTQLIGILSGVIVMTTQILALGLRKIRQPKVIAEVIGGILLGMSC